MLCCHIVKCVVCLTVAGEAFSVSDVAVGAYIAYVEIFGIGTFAQYKNVTRYMGEIKKREAFKQTIGTEYP